MPESSIRIRDSSAGGGDDIAGEGMMEGFGRMRHHIHDQGYPLNLAEIGKIEIDSELAEEPQERHGRKNLAAGGGSEGRGSQRAGFQRYGVAVENLALGRRDLCAGNHCKRRRGIASHGCEEWGGVEQNGTSDGILVDGDKHEGCLIKFARTVASVGAIIRWLQAPLKLRPELRHANAITGSAEFEIAILSNAILNQSGASVSAVLSAINSVSFSQKAA
ncbi:hypothetical protein C8J57DRAFT_1242300 [Mycena rebaudengoi]|nr:hypothetical protein C8J57DRAFT_1242300 [Mycena rebaudengoi]